MQGEALLDDRGGLGVPLQGDEFGRGVVATGGEEVLEVESHLGELAVEADGFQERVDGFGVPPGVPQVQALDVQGAREFIPVAGRVEARQLGQELHHPAGALGCVRGAP
ncbi:hypothetical protein ACFWJ4_18825 [Kitasatospora sp. NPDC127067]|uniref:hypothetical protein n=1 Tax=Kitasatospora sp. NPDC127067 TaxID=3347126 RepID=UPI00364E4E25